MNPAAKHEEVKTAFIKLTADLEDRIAKAYIECLRDRDLDRFLALNEKIRGLLVPHPHVDKVRYTLLSLMIANRLGVNWKFTISEIAEVVGYSASGKGDGYSALRRLCKKIGFLISPSHGGTRPKTESGSDKGLTESVVPSGKNIGA